MTTKSAKFVTYFIIFYVCLLGNSMNNHLRNGVHGKCSNQPEAIHETRRLSEYENTIDDQQQHKDCFENKRIKRLVQTNLQNDIDSGDTKYLQLNDDLVPKRMSKSLLKPNTQADVADNTTILANGRNEKTSARQNASPDIQDIITGIVKLLNGNVNVHANTQQQQSPVRRPTHVRINNRGPPRISDAQPVVPLDYLEPHASSNKPFNFERPGGGGGGGVNPMRPPYFNGLIEPGIPPSVQQNYRPNFVSQNRPPWQRPRPPPPIGDHKRPMSTIRIEPPLYEPNFINHIHETSTKLDELETIDLNTLELNQSTPIKNESIDNNNNNNEPEEQNVEEIEIDMRISPSSSAATTTTIVVVTQPPNLATANEYTNNIDLNTPTPTIPSIQSSSDNSFSIFSQSSQIVESSMDETTSLSSIFSSSTTPALSTINSNILDQSIQNYPIGSDGTRTTTTTPPLINVPYTTRHGIVLDDPDFSRQNHRPHIKQTSTVAYQGYGEIFDVTLSAIQGLGGADQTQNVNLNAYNDQGAINTGTDDFVSIDGRKSYINLFDTSTGLPGAASVNGPNYSAKPIQSTQSQKVPEIRGTGYAIVEKEPVNLPPAHNAYPKQHYIKTKPIEQNPIRIDTCIVGDDSTCDKAQNERCKIDNSVSSCHCRPGYARKKDQDPCRKIVSILMSLRVDKIYDRKITWDQSLLNKQSDPYRQLSFESIRAIDSAMSMTPFSDEFLDAYVNNIYNGDASQGFAGVFVNLTLQLEENGGTLRPSVKSDIQKHLLGVINRRNNNIGKSVLYVESALGSISNLQDLDECTSMELNDCHTNAVCENIWGSYRCRCTDGLRDPWSDHLQRSGRECISCSNEYCNNRGSCLYKENAQICTCEGSYYGAQCEIDGEVLGVAVGASVAAIIIILLTLVCLILWSRKWQREHKSAMEGPMFGYMSGSQLKQSQLCSPYQVALEDRIRWAHAADVMAQTNHYEINPSAPTILNYPNLPMASNAGTLSIADVRSQSGLHKPIPLPRYGFDYTTGKSTMENSSVSEEETSRADLLDRNNFQVPRPRSRTNASINSQSGIYYDVDIDSSEANLYETTQSTSHTFQKHFIPMTTYSAAGRVNSSYYKN